MLKMRQQHMASQISMLHPVKITVGPFAQEQVEFEAYPSGNVYWPDIDHGGVLPKYGIHDQHAGSVVPEHVATWRHSLNTPRACFLRRGDTPLPCQGRGAWRTVKRSRDSRMPPPSQSASAMSARRGVPCVLPSWLNYTLPPSFHAPHVIQAPHPLRVVSSSNTSTCV
ncbi:uncharacterized protein LOC130940075 [Arachis stenosperma]|uniref:uncharacterized protein LOC130940075 n=1 Tax=Arachis stenosperma TaxID=217475 RepID=UPI0025AC47F2|nr:uncharacterized protein LOC130940075 [Arachis stenosperma]